MEMIEQTIEGLASSLNGRLIRRVDPSYDEVRRLYNGMIANGRWPSPSAPMSPRGGGGRLGRQHGLRVAVAVAGHTAGTPAASMTAGYRPGL